MEDPPLLGPSDSSSDAPGLPKPNPLRRSLTWIEVYARTYYLLLSLLVAFTAVPTLYGRAIGLWHAAHVSFPAGYFAVALFTGDESSLASKLNKLSPRYSLHLGYVLVGGLVTVGLGIAFIVVQLVYIFGNKAARTLDACSTYVPYLVAMSLSAGLTLLSVLLIVSVCYLWFSSPAPGDRRRVHK